MRGGINVNKQGCVERGEGNESELKNAGTTTLLCPSPSPRKTEETGSKPEAQVETERKESELGDQHL